MKKSKSLFLTLCISLALSSSVFAFAEENNPSSNSPTIESNDAAETEASTTETLPELESTTETPEISTPETKEPSTQETESLISAESETIPKKTADLQEKALKSTDVKEENYENKQVFQFVKRMYETVLGREPDSEGMNTWYNSLISGAKTGDEIVHGFFFSEEFTQANYSDEEYIRRLYRALFNREPDADGLQNWLDTCNDGMSRRYVCSGFIGSTEYVRMCESYGITPGTMTTYESRDINQNITRFVNHFYIYCLNRNGDAHGLNDWTSALIEKRHNGVSLLEGFIYSEEFQNRNLSNDDFVEILYQALLGRPSDASGKATWVNRLNEGVSKRYVLVGFIYSTEFTQLCESYGIVRGDLAVDESRDKNADLTAYIQHLFNTCFNRKANTDELNKWTNDIMNCGVIAEDIALSFFNSDSYINKGCDDTTFIKDMYSILLQAEASSSDISKWQSILKSTSRDDVLKQFTSTQEYKALCSSIGIPTIRDGWVREGDNIYYYENGRKKTGWHNENGYRYYLNPAKGGAQEIGWEYVDGYKLYFNNDGQLVQDVEYLIGAQDSYFIKVYKWGNYLIVFAKDGNNGYTIPVKAMIASCGNGTPTGDYWTPNKFRWLTMVGGSKAQWCTQIIESYLFHSVPYRIADNTTLYTDLMYNYLGTTQSLGCIRLQAGDAKWIYDNCSLGTHVNIDPYTNSGPFDKPSFSPLPSWHTWDPTDPTAQYLCRQHGCH